MKLALYRLATTLGEPLIRLYLIRRLGRGKEPKERFNERMGIPRTPRPAGPVVWLHGASVGESISMLPVVERLRAERPDLNLLVTTGTVTSAALLEGRLPDGVIHQYAPVDRPKGVARFLGHWRPDLALWWESEFWPNLIAEAKALGVPLVLVNGRISDRSFERWKRHPEMIRELLSAFALCLGQTREDAERLAALGAVETDCLGNLKFAVPALPADDGDLAALAAEFGRRPRWLAASTHAGEEDIAWRAHRSLVDGTPGLLTVIAPRHPERGDDIAGRLRESGARVARRSRRESVTADIDVYVADTLGEMGLLFRLCPVVFMGKSLVPGGGQNPIEPARAGCAVVAGPHMENFTEIVRRMRQGGAVVDVADGDSLAAEVGRLLADPAARDAAAARARAFADGEAGVLDRVVERLAPFLDAASANGEAR